MVNLGDFVRWGFCTLDELFVESSGRPFTHASSGVELKGIYEIPVSSATKYGIDTPDGMEVEVGYNATVKRLGKVPEIGEFFTDLHGDKWVLANMYRRDDMFRGRNRLVLQVDRYQESKTVKSSKETDSDNFVVHDLPGEEE